MVLHSAKNVDETKFFTEDPDELQLVLLLSLRKYPSHLHNIRAAQSNN